MENVKQVINFTSLDMLILNEVHFISLSTQLKSLSQLISYKSYAK